MENPLRILDDIQIAAPCTADWEAMPGNDRVRHCAQCDQKVYDLSMLTRREATELVTGSQKACVRLFRRPDGRVITRDCLAGRLRVLRIKSRRAMWLAASWLGLTWLSGCGKTVMGEPEIQGLPAPPIPKPVGTVDVRPRSAVPEGVMGGVCLPPVQKVPVPLPAIEAPSTKSSTRPLLGKI